MSFETHPLWLLAGLLSMSSGLLVMVLRHNYSEHLGKAMNWWGAACLLMGAAFCLSARSQEMAVTIAIPLLGTMGLAVQYVAVVELKQQKRQPAWIWLPIVATCAVYLGQALTHPHATLALGLFHVIRVAMMLRVAASLLEREDGERQLVDSLAAGTFLLLAAATLWVVADAFWGRTSTSHYALDSRRTLINVTAVVVTQSILFSLFLLAITERLNRRFKDQAMHDPLTNLFNRRALEAIGEHQKALSLRMGLPFSVFMIDVDHFKEINDSFGHAAGDFILRSAGISLKRALRNEDYLGRWGGDEFCVLLPGAARAQAELVAERVLTMFEGLDLHVGGRRLSLSVSIGVASIEESVGGFNSLIALADRALYRAKEAGRRRFVIADHREAGIEAIERTFASN